MVYRDEVVALRARLDALERELADAADLSRRVEQLEAENQALRARLVEANRRLRELEPEPSDKDTEGERAARRYQQNIDSLRALADSSRSDRVRCEYLLQIARIYVRRLDEPDKARDVYREALAIDPGYEVARAELEALEPEAD